MTPKEFFPDLDWSVFDADDMSWLNRGTVRQRAAIVNGHELHRSTLRKLASKISREHGLTVDEVLDLEILDETYYGDSTFAFTYDRLETDEEWDKRVRESYKKRVARKSKKAAHAAVRLTKKVVENKASKEERETLFNLLKSEFESKNA